MYTAKVLPEIHIRLEAWAYWSLAKSAGGYPKMSAFARLTPRDSTRHAGFGNIDENSWEVEQAVQALNTKFKQAIKSFYLGVGTLEQRARDCGCCRVTLLSRIDRAQECIAATLSENRRAAIARRSAAN